MFLPHMAYVLATSYHETAATMQPIAEYGKGKGLPYLTYYDSSKKSLCKYKPQDAYGRGFVQLTWEANYERADKECKLGGALIKNFDLALDMDVASKIIFDGMLQGWFTSQKLDDHINDSKTDYYEARTIVNGHDDAQLIANYAIAAETILRESGFGEVIPEPEPEEELTDALTQLQNALHGVIEALEEVKNAR